MLYRPDGAAEQYFYGSFASMHDRISRVTDAEYAPSGGGWTSMVSYGYLGLGMVSHVDYPEIDVQLDYTLGADGKRRVGYTTGTAGDYLGYDGFGRIRRQTWADGSLTVHGSLSTVPNIPPIFEEVFTYDRASNRLSKDDDRPGSSWGNRDFRYTYDNLDRLLQAERGSNGVSWSNGVGTQEWALDMLGNWDSSGTDLNGDGDTSDTLETLPRTHNKANEVTSVNSSSPGTYVWDPNGNALTIGAFRTYAHDAWNRLVQAGLNTIPAATSGEYEYYALHWRSVKRADVLTGVSGLDQRRIFYYDASWRVIEERIDDGYTVGGGEGGHAADDRIAEQYWGMRYIDDPVLRRMIPVANPSNAEPFYHITDAQFSTRALLDGSGALVERVTYAAYGEARHHHAADTDGDGDADGADVTLVTGLSGETIGAGTYAAEADLNRDGVINATDATLAGASAAALAAGMVSDPSGPDNPFGYCGYVFNPETGVSLSRFRHYDAKLGRWLERDFVRYVDGMNRYQYIASKAVTLIDPTGQDGEDPPGTQPNSIPSNLEDPSTGCGIKVKQYDIGNGYAHRWIEMTDPKSGLVQKLGYEPTGNKNGKSKGKGGAFWGQGAWEAPNADPNDSTDNCLCVPQNDSGAGTSPDTTYNTVPDFTRYWELSPNGTNQNEGYWVERPNPAKPLKFGKGKGKTLPYGGDYWQPGAVKGASCDEIRDCLHRFQPDSKYVYGINDCRDVADEALNACGLKRAK